LSVKTHNWNQFHRVLLENLGYKQILSYDRDIIFYESPSRRKLGIKKSNIMSMDYVLAILWQIGLDYQAFVNYYST